MNDEVKKYEEDIWWHEGLLMEAVCSFGDRNRVGQELIALASGSPMAGSETLRSVLQPAVHAYALEIAGYETEEARA